MTLTVYFPHRWIRPRWKSSPDHWTNMAVWLDEHYPDGWPMFTCLPGVMGHPEELVIFL
jgi:hypothetical protein